MVLKDENLREIEDDPRKLPGNNDGEAGRIRSKGKGRNTESFDPESTLVRAMQTLRDPSKSRIVSTVLSSVLKGTYLLVRF